MKNLKQLVRNIVDPSRDLGHVDRNHNGGKPESASDEKPSPMSSGQSSAGKAEESFEQERRRMTSSTKSFKASNDDQGQTMRPDADADVARGVASETNGDQEEWNGKSTGEGEACEDCR